MVSSPVIFLFSLNPSTLSFHQTDQVFCHLTHILNPLLFRCLIAPIWRTFCTADLFLHHKVLIMAHRVIYMRAEGAIPAMLKPFMDSQGNSLPISRGPFANHLYSDTRSLSIHHLFPLQLKTHLLIPGVEKEKQSVGIFLQLTPYLSLSSFFNLLYSFSIDIMFASLSLSLRQMSYFLDPRNLRFSSFLQILQ